MATYLLKTEPGTYSYADLTRDGSTRWSGVTSAPALIHLRAMRKGDDAFLYHTGDERAIVGLAQVTTDAYADPDKPGLNARGEPAFPVVDIKPIKQAPTAVTLAAIKSDAAFADFALVRQSRLSVMPVPAALARRIRALAGL